MTARYALYYAPEPDSALAAFGAAWLGRDAAGGTAVPQPAVPGLPPERLAALTAAPRRYGFHGTMKAPFPLAAGVDRGDLVAALAAFAAGRRPLTLPPLRLSALGQAGQDPFLALVPSRPCRDICVLANECVAIFDRFRAPLDAAERQRRRAGGLTPNQERLLARWGYPFVFDEFRFHLTLTGALPDPATQTEVALALGLLVAPLCQDPVPVRSLSLFEEPERGADFRLTERFPLGG